MGEVHTEAEYQSISFLLDEADGACQELEARLAAAEAEVARLREALATTGEARECANFSPAGPLNCYVEPPEGWAVKLDPCPFCALALTDKEAP